MVFRVELEAYRTAKIKSICVVDYCLNSPPGAYAEKIHSHLRPNDRVLIELLLARSEVCVSVCVCVCVCVCVESTIDIC